MTAGGTSIVSAEAIAQLVKAFNRHDPAGCAACFSEDAVREHRFRSRVLFPGVEYPRHEGRDQIAESYARFFGVVSDSVVHVERLAQSSDDCVWVELAVSGIRVGDAVSAGGPVSFPVVSLFRTSDGLIAEERVYMDPALATPEPGRRAG
jgi:ketosteroid isomerase-like protein